MASTADFRNGMVIKYNNDFYTIVEFQHVKPGKGAAFVRTKLKSVTTGKVLENTFSAGAKVETARIERRPYQFLYNDELGYHFMHTETFEQITLPEDHINNPRLLKENQQVEILFHDESETPIRCELPQFVEMEVDYTEPGVKGDTTSTTALKPATLETGAEIKVPLFINTGEKIKVDTRDSSYVERIKK
ncbi:MAG: elongation factor P [Bacteroidales bacterium]|nr:elongation factor P [Bacteroidales bacterium]MBS3775729.1 elongation factor P [Bacteroidales bacterium]